MPFLGLMVKPQHPGEELLLTMESRCMQGLVHTEPHWVLAKLIPVDAPDRLRDRIDIQIAPVTNHSNDEV